MVTENSATSSPKLQRPISLDNSTLRRDYKALRKAAYLCEANFDLFVYKLAFIEEDDGIREVLQNFHQDASNTADIMFEVYNLCRFADENHNLYETKHHKTKGPQVTIHNLKDIFGEFYNEDAATIQFKGFTLDATRKHTKESIFEEIINSILDIEFSDYENYRKIQKELYEGRNYIPVDDKEKVQYLAFIKELDKYAPIVEKVYNINKNYESFQSSFSTRNKRIRDKYVTFQRAGIVDIVKTNTYISKDIGIEQVAKDHKHQHKLLEELTRAIDDSKYITAVEIDHDADLSPYIYLIDQINEVKPNFGPNALPQILKGRKMGNYKAMGKYFVNLGIVALDSRDPSAYMHEFGHAVYEQNHIIKNAQATDALIQILLSNMDLKVLETMVTPKMLEYYKMPTEIFARACEIGTLFTSYDYNPDEETFDAFRERVRVKERTIRKEGEIRKIFPIDVYCQENMKRQYFNIETMSPELIKDLKAYMGAVFKVEGQEPVNINDFKPLAKLSKTINTQEINKFERTCVSAFNSDNIEYILEYNHREKFMPPEALFENILSNLTTLSRTTKKYSNESYADQKEIIGKMVDWVKEKEDPILKKILFENLVKIGVYSNGKSYSTPEVSIILRDGIPAAKQLVRQEIVEKHREELDRTTNELSEASKEKAYSRGDDYKSALEHWHEKKSALTAVQNLISAEFEIAFQDFSEEAANLYDLNKQYWYFTTEASKTGFGTKRYYSSTLGAKGKAALTKPILDLMVSELSDKPEAILNQLTMNDTLLYALAFDEKLKELFEPDALQKIQNHLKGVMVANGLVDKIADPDNLFVFENGTRKVYKTDPLEIFGYEKLNSTGKLDLELKILKKEVSADDIKALAPNVQREWDLAQKDIKEHKESFAKQKVVAIAYDEVEEIVKKPFDTKEFLDNFATQLQRHSAKENRPATPTITNKPVLIETKSDNTPTPPPSTKTSHSTPKVKLDKSRQQSLF